MEEPKDYSYEEFKAKWPDMFENVYCGFSLPEGWGPLVWKLCGLIDWEVNGNPHRWEKDPDSKPDPKVAQVKEKFGGLRFYCDGTNETISAFITFAECLSNSICLNCGTNGVDVKTENVGWWICTLCDECREKEVNGRESAPK